MADHKAAASPQAGVKEDLVTSALPVGGTSDESCGHEAERPPVSILIPTYGSADALKLCLESLAAHAPASSIVYVLDDGTPDTSIRSLCQEVQNTLTQLRYLRSDVNLGFVGICNWGRRALGDALDSDILLLNSDTEVTTGFLEEMQEVLYLHDKHAVVTPRSNNATLFSIPPVGDILPERESYKVWLHIRKWLPRFHVTPTAVGFCMLIKREVLERFDLFDEIYSPGYNEENDFICRINRYGYSAISANWAYVFHHEQGTFRTQRARLEPANRKVLLKRYPEYERKISEYVQYHLDPVEIFAGLHAAHRRRILYDIAYFPPVFNGTTEFGLNLLREVSRLVEDEFELYVGVGEHYSFFSNELTGYRLYREHPGAPMMFDLAYQPCQVLSWQHFKRLTQLAPRVAYTLQDLVAVRCDYISGVNRNFLFRKTAQLADRVFAISEFSRADFAAFYGIDVPMKVIYHGTKFGALSNEFVDGEYVLVMGNDFVHKAVRDAIKELGDDLPVIALGADKEASEQKLGNLQWLRSGSLSRQYMRELLMKARVVVYPSHYEGFGLPVVDALALGKPVVALDNAVNCELAKLTNDSNLVRIRSLKLLRETVERLFRQSSTGPQTVPRRWRAAAEEYAAAFRELLSDEIDVSRLRARWDAIRTLESVGPI